jgi:hypothetical protein
VLCITETWLHADTTNSIILNGSTYSIFRTDRSTSRCGGGVCILSNNRSTKVSRVSLPTKYSHLELCVVDIVSRNKIRVFVCYRPPSGDCYQPAVQYVRDLCDCISSLYPANSAVILCGDFNFPNIDWSVNNCLRCSNSTCSGLFLEFFYNHGLQQFVSSPTRYMHTLDLVLCNDSNCVINTKILEPFSTSDHCQVSFQVPYKITSDNNVFITRDFKLADWAGISTFLNQVDFYHLFHSNMPCASIINEFYNVLNQCIERYVPTKRNTNSNNSKLVKYPYRIRRLLRLKAALWRKYRTFKSPASLVSYKKAASDSKSAIYSFNLLYENNLIANANIGSFYRYANSKFSSKSAVGPLCNSDGSLIVDSTDKATILLQTFTKNFTVDNNVLPDVSNFQRSQQKLSYIHFSPTLVRRAIKKLKHKTKGGPDGIPPSFFINCCEELCYPLSVLFTLSFDCGILPSAWLTSFTTPIFKKGNSADPNNYRPIALTATMCKIMESIMKDQIVSFLVEKGLISKHQHAFIKNHSTATNLLECLQDWSVGLNSRTQTDIVYIDFAKAFDSIVIVQTNI